MTLIMEYRKKLIRGTLAWVFAILLSTPAWGKDPKPSTILPKTLTLRSVLKQLEKEHPLLKKSQTNKTIASGKVLKALGKFEPALVNDWELERLAKVDSTKSVGFNDTFIEMTHPLGFKGFAGFRAGIGDVAVSDLAIGTSNQPLLGIVFPLLRGFITNPARAELKKSHLADRQAELEIQQTRQDLFLGAATQYWNWVAAWKIMEIKKNAVSIAKKRFEQITGQAKAGAKAPIDVVDANQEVQSRRNKSIEAQRKVEQEQYKLALFLWDKDSVIVPETNRAPAFSTAQSESWLLSLDQAKLQATSNRPEIKLIELEAEFNNIDLEVAENNLLPDLTVEAVPTRKPGEFVLGLGYRFGVQLRFPFLQRGARGEIIELKGKADQLRLMQKYSLQQVSMEVANAHSSVVRARERIDVSRQAMDLAKTLVQGERTRFKLGASNLLVVNIRERNVIDATEDWINAMADHQKALSHYHWAIGKWTKSPSSANNKKRVEKGSP